MGVDFISRVGRLDPARPALVFPGGAQLSYGDLQQRIGARLQTFGDRRRLILWEALPEADALVTYLAALAGGHPIMPLSPRAPLQELICLYRPDLVFHRSHRGPAHLPEGSSEDCHPDLSLLLSTSGSTGATKLVRLSAGNIVSNAASIAEYLGLTADDRAALVLPLHYSYGLSVLHAHLAAGASVFLGPQSLTAAGALDDIANAGCTNLSGVPYSFDLLEQIGFRERLPDGLRFLTVAGGRMAPALVRTYAMEMAARGGSFFVMYGQTEATARIAFLPPERALDHPDCIGDVIPGGNLTLIDPDKDGIGELVYRGPNVMMGYAQTRADLARGSDCDHLATGDLAERVSPGLYRLAGRKSRFSKIAGLRIAHDEVEKQLAVRSVVAFVTGDDQALQIAFTGDMSVRAVREMAAAITGLNSGFMQAMPCAELPRHENGKPDYGAIRAYCARQVVPGADDPVLAAFAETFAPRRVRPEDSFKSLGGDSLGYLQLSLALEAIFGAVPQQWETTPIATLAALRTTGKAHTARHGRRAWWRPAPVETDHFLRAIAISLVVLHHATMWPLAGGAAVLLMLVGYNLARFHGPRLLAGDGIGVLRIALRPVLIYYPLLLAYCVYVGDYPWQSLLLVGNWGIDGYSTLPSPITPYWFIEAYLQIVLIAILIFAVPAVRRQVSKWPLLYGLAFLAFAILLRETVNLVWHAGEMNIFFTPRILYVPVLGWCLFYATGFRQRLWLTALALALVLGLPFAEGNNATILWVRAGILAAAVVMLVWCARMLLPALMARATMLIAGASFSIYLFHNLPYYLWLDDGVGGRALWPAHFLLGLAAGILLHYVLAWAGRCWRNSRALQRLTGFWPRPVRMPAAGE